MQTNGDNHVCYYLGIIFVVMRCKKCFDVYFNLILGLILSRLFYLRTTMQAVAIHNCVL